VRRIHIERTCLFVCAVGRSIEAPLAASGGVARILMAA
jgi:hypothetical protein